MEVYTHSAQLVLSAGDDAGAAAATPATTAQCDERAHWTTIIIWSILKWKTSALSFYMQYDPIKNGRIKNQNSDYKKNKEPGVRILGLKNRFTF